MAPLVRFGLFAVGLSLVLDQVRPMISDAQFTWGERRVMGIVALVTLGGFGLAGWVAGRLLKASAELIDLFIDGADAAWRAADLIELQLVPTLGRIAAALERAPVPPANGNAAKDDALSGARRAIADRRWGDADRLLAGFRRDFPDATETAAIAGELQAAREAAAMTLRSELESAQRANDLDRVIECRDELTQYLRGQALHDLDQAVVRWLIIQVQRRVRAGDRSADVAGLAGRIVDSFGDTAEVASLRGALPSLRRSAGLCPRCSRPFQGTAEACPRCSASAAATAST
jgi:hypothetical protein